MLPAMAGFFLEQRRRAAMLGVVAKNAAEFAGADDATARALSEVVTGGINPNLPELIVAASRVAGATPVAIAAVAAIGATHSSTGEPRRVDYRGIPAEALELISARAVDLGRRIFQMNLDAGFEPDVAALAALAAVAVDAAQNGAQNAARRGAVPTILNLASAAVIAIEAADRVIRELLPEARGAFEVRKKTS